MVRLVQTLEKLHEAGFIPSLSQYGIMYKFDEEKGRAMLYQQNGRGKFELQFDGFVNSCSYIERLLEDEKFLRSLDNVDI